MSPLLISAGPDVDLKKLRLLTLCIAERAPDIGVTKLEKLMYLCDFEAIRTLGKSISSDVYKNFQWGPVPKHFKVAFNELVLEGRLSSAEKEIRPGIPFTEIKPKENCPQDAFSPDEWAVIERVLKQYGHLPGKALVKMTHDQLPWKLTKRNEEIPDFLAHYVGHSKPTAEELAALVDSRGYLPQILERISAAA